MDKTALIAQLAAYLAEHSPHGRPEADTPLLDDWFATSLEVINMAMFLEKSFAIRLRDSDISADNFATLNSLADFVLTRQAG